MTRVLVLNADYSPINVTTVHRAVVLLLKGKAEAIESDAVPLRSVSMTYVRPVVIRLVFYVRVPRETNRRITRRAILARDNHTCQYCGATSDLTIDHVIPKTRGGPHTWDNVVAACWPCNKRKGHALPREAGMKLARTPRTPTALAFVFVAIRKPPEAWRPWIFR